MILSCSFGYNNKNEGETEMTIETKRYTVFARI